MTDWLALAKARAIALPPEDLERMAAILAALERDFAPLAGSIPLDAEPAAVFHADSASGMQSM